MTLKEYLEDYAGDETKENGTRLIQSQLDTIPNEKVRHVVEERLTKIHNGERDFRF